MKCPDCSKEMKVDNTVPGWSVIWDCFYCGVKWMILPFKDVQEVTDMFSLAQHLPAEKLHQVHKELAKRSQ